MTYAAPVTYAAPMAEPLATILHGPGLPPLVYAAPTTYAAPQATYASYGAPLQVGGPVGYATFGAPMQAGFAQGPTQKKQKKQKKAKSKVPKFEATNQLVPDAA